MKWLTHKWFSPPRGRRETLKCVLIRILGNPWVVSRDGTTAKIGTSESLQVSRYKKSQRNLGPRVFKLAETSLNLQILAGPIFARDFFVPSCLIAPGSLRMTSKLQLRWIYGGHLECYRSEHSTMECQLGQMHSSFGEALVLVEHFQPSETPQTNTLTIRVNS